MLILFDIDATLLTTGGAGIHAMGRAGRALFGDHFDERSVEYAGRLDPLIMNDLLATHAVEPTADAMGRFRDAYHEHLGVLLTSSGVSAPCPGVIDLLDALAKVEGVTLGLLTGNFPETGALKLRAGGIDPARFAIAAWGSDSPIQPPAREHLPPVAMERYRTLHNREIPADHVTIIGDTPHDVACAKAHACRVLGVATGMFPREALEAAGADRAVESLADTDDIVRWLLSVARDRKGGAAQASSSSGPTSEADGRACAR
jgi:phosphoglycolate phosphatase-like HAD superfamily hydrolase